MKEEKLKAILLLAGVEYSGAHRILNGYYGIHGGNPEYAVNNPWWLISTRHGLIEIGWRKRVISIDWSETAFRGTITKDDVTKSDAMVHAWSYGKAVDYIKSLMYELNKIEPAKPPKTETPTASDQADVLAQTGQG
ncbi:MAG: hypothetical protein COA96_16825 [SAR86 cluster bacterium]|uniref:Uncharacterized protein n=1 Tax=SAR86 cluster bacterium TaxID=2030880 RepID=A0A2A5AG77_9GAMM|nr:MAG: hypothetical protein COA96_16825 [SAR86 cluster bacterium]